MKKLLALLFVCAGLTAMAGTPNQAFKVKMSKAEMTQMKAQAQAQAQAQLMPKGNMMPLTLNNQLVAPSLAPQNLLLKQNNLMKRAPRRVAADQVFGDRLSFANLYDWNQEMVIGENGDTTYTMNLFESDPFMAGESMRIYEDSYSDGTTTYTDTLLSSLYYFEDIPIHLDLDNNKAYLGDAEGYNVTSEVVSIDTVSSGGGWFQQTNYVYHVYMIWLVAGDVFTEDVAEHLIEGQISEDGSLIYFPGNMVFYFAQYKRTLNSNGQWTGSWTQEDGPWLTRFIGDVMLAAPNGTHEYTDDEGTTETNGVLMYQNETADTVVVWNLYDLGMPGNFMTLKSDYTMEFPAQYVYDFYDSATNQAGDSIGGDFYNIYYLVNETDTIVELGNKGVFNESQITWENCLLLNDNTALALFVNNKLTFTDGTLFRVPEPVEVYLRGDVDNDGKISINDVTTLINALLTGDFDDSEHFNSVNADCDLSGDYKIGDVTALINYLLSGEWENQ